MWVVFAGTVQLSPFILYAWLTLCSLWVLQLVAIDLHCQLGEKPHTHMHNATEINY